jgi:hypothetical protein
MVPLTPNKASSKEKCAFEIGPPAWVKEINTSTMENVFVSTISCLFVWARNLIYLCPLFRRNVNWNFARIWHLMTFAPQRTFDASITYNMCVHGITRGNKPVYWNTCFDIVSVFVRHLAYVCTTRTSERIIKPHMNKNSGLAIIIHYSSTVIPIH